MRVGKFSEIRESELNSKEIVVCRKYFACFIKIVYWMSNKEKEKIGACNREEGRIRERE